ncbi:hypothetical protein EGH25_08535 [Haladaptatus sp. F3-133]|uniref:Uncharacterized protein n=1 Tax=Halorutilus salinus TaxID=2487751 RepID=A0A9Q4GI18_9EURY|nr:hypothetical protein [Halorutilus salinus]MCX2819395.1 hypothetical protein [Halorutilus salinus]
MSTKPLVSDTNPSPGEYLDTLRDKQDADEISELRVSGLEEQKKIADGWLGTFLSNISDSAGAREVVESYYQKEHNKRIDASDVEVLNKEVPSIESIVERKKLPVLSKEDLREEYSVEGGWIDEKKKDQNYLVPRWVEDHGEEPLLDLYTSGTTGDPWVRSMTRNDAATYLMQNIYTVHKIIDEEGLEPERTNSVSVMEGGHEELSKMAIQEFRTTVGMDPILVSIKSIETGGAKEAKQEAERIIQHINSAEYSVVVGPAQLLTIGKVGISMRRGELDLDLFINAGRPLSGDLKEIIGNTATVRDLYGETEYPQMSAAKRTVQGVTGFDLPFDAQMNFIYDEDDEELKYEGEGRFAYLPFATEGYGLPGVYLSGIEGKIKKLNDGHQMLQDVNRVTGGEREEGCE